MLAMDAEETEHTALSAATTFQSITEVFNIGVCAAKAHYGRELY